MKEKPTVMAVVNQKGGTAKTTTVENLGIGLTKAGKKVLLVDCDPQASLTISLGYPQPDDLPVTLTDMLAKTLRDEAFDPSEGILHHPEGVDLESIEPGSEAEAELTALIQEHQRETGSAIAALMLSDWERYRAKFVRVFPVEYRNALKQEGMC